MKLFLLLILAVFASENGVEIDSKCEERIWENREKNPILVKIEEDEYVKVNKKSKFIGVSYNERDSKWRVQRWSKNENRRVSNGYYDDEETAARASDTLARKLMENGELNLKLNFPDDHTEVHPEEKQFTSKFIGVTYNKKESKWKVQRRSKNEKTMVTNGYYDDEETAARASDTLARKFMQNGELKIKINFPDDHTEVYPEEKTTSSKYIGVSYNEKKSKWRVQRRSKNENKVVTNGCYDDEETAAHASDTLARKLMENDEQNHKLNFPDDHTEVYPEEKTSKYIGVSYNKKESKWSVQRWSKNESRNFFNGYHHDEETAAHASDTLARKLMKNGEQKLKLNFPDDHTEIYPKENQKNKRKRRKNLTLKHPQNN